MSEFREIIRVAGADIDGNRKLYLALKKIRGVDFMFSNALIKVLKMDGDMKAGNLEEKDVKKIEDALENPGKYGIPEFLMNRRKDFETGENKHIVSSDLQLTEEMDIRRLKKIKSYRGIRHGRNLPVRGQRTKSGYTRPPAKRHRRETVIGVRKKKKTPEKKKEGKK